MKSWIRNLLAISWGHPQGIPPYNYLVYVWDKGLPILWTPLLAKKEKKKFLYVFILVLSIMQCLHVSMRAMMHIYKQIDVAICDCG
jgi:hypothetical protein